MWNKTFAGFFCGMLFMVFLPSAISLFFKQHIALILAIAIVISLTSWAVIMTWCYAADSGKQAWKRGGIAALPAVGLYAIGFFTVGLV